jgi:hypothetical protein
MHVHYFFLEALLLKNYFDSLSVIFGGGYSAAVE